MCIDYHLRLRPTLNEKVNKVEGIPQDAKEFEFKVPLEDGVNYLKINAYENGLMTEYKIIMPEEDIAGVKEYKITEVLLQNNKKVKVDYTNKIDVLKKAPTIQNYVITEDINNSQIKLEFTVEDLDNAIVEYQKRTRKFGAN